MPPIHFLVSYSLCILLLVCMQEEEAQGFSTTTTTTTKRVCRKRRGPALDNVALKTSTHVDQDDDDDDETAAVNGVEEFSIYSRDLLQEEKVQDNNKQKKQADSNSLLAYQMVDHDSDPQQERQGRWWRWRWWRQLLLRRRGGHLRPRPRPRRSQKPGKLILLRNGESTWNNNGTFTGWGDPDLSTSGITECEYAARLLVAEGYEPDVVYTSRLKRAINSARVVLENIDALFLPLYKSWRLNERCYGALTGLSKKEMAQRFGTSVVQAWRTSLKAKPPPHSLATMDPWYPGNDPRYADLLAAANNGQGILPTSESLLDTFRRTRPLWEQRIRHDLARGDTVLVVGHGNSLRGLIQAIDNVSDQDITQIQIPAAIPLVYRFDKTMQPLAPPKNKPSQMYTSAMFLEKPERLQEALRKQHDWKTKVPGVSENESMASAVRRKETLEDSLALLKQQQMEPSVLQSLYQQERWEDDPCEFEEPEYDEFFAETIGMDRDIKHLPKEYTNIMVNIEPLPDDESGANQDDGPVVVFIRHGRTPHNNLALFTGWEDPPLAPEGVQDAKRAGQILKRHGYKFDVVYTSWLTRAIQTALCVLGEMDAVWVPIIKSWRLNERMYGALTGKSKAMIANEYGEEQLKKWRRGFKIRPPPVSSYSPSYPGNDYRRIKYVQDLPISWWETINRSIEARKLEIHRKFPKTESLHDCMKRSIPFYTERIVKEAVSKGKRVLVTGHENSIRGILMHLCNIPESAMNQLHIPNGMPLIYSLKGKCIKILDDGSGRDPMDIHDFGPAAQYLFKPCELDDSFFDKMARTAESKPQFIAKRSPSKEEMHQTDDEVQGAATLPS